MRYPRTYVADAATYPPDLSPVRPLKVKSRNDVQAVTRLKEKAERRGLLLGYVAEILPGKRTERSVWDPLSGFIK